MAEPMLNYGPETSHDDELFIAKGYQPDGWFLAPRIAIMFGTAYFLDVKWVVAIGVLMILETVRAFDGRFLDVCTRLRRTNKLLSERNSN